jgi:hypothetical protein
MQWRMSQELAAKLDSERKIIVMEDEMSKLTKDINMLKAKDKASNIT